MSCPHAASPSQLISHFKPKLPYAANSPVELLEVLLLARNSNNAHIHSSSSMPAAACPSTRCSHLLVRNELSRHCHLTLQQASTTCFYSHHPRPIMLSMSILNSKCRPPIPHSEIILSAFFVAFCTPHKPDCFHAVFTLPPHSSHPPPIPNLSASHSVCGATTTKVAPGLCS